jgi:hypothetical protein
VTTEEGKVFSRHIDNIVQIMSVYRPAHHKVTKLGMQASA